MIERQSMFARKSSAAFLAAVVFSAAGSMLPTMAVAASAAPAKPVIAPADAPIRYPAYPVAKRIEPIVPARPVSASIATRKGVTTASNPKNVAAPKSVPTRAAAGNVPLAGKSALGAPLPPVKPPSIKVTKPKASAKAAAAKR